jgi:hypothetical protein
MERTHRVLVSRVIRVALIVVAIVLAGSWIFGRVRPSTNFTLESTPTSVEALSAGDVQIFNIDSTVDLVLKDQRILAGLSPQMVTKVRGELAKEQGKDSGLGGSIAAMVKKTVSDNIATRVVYDINDIEDMRYEGEQIVIDWKSGRTQKLFGGVQVQGDREANRFRREDATRFIELVKARQRTP